MTRWRRLPALLVAASLVVAACGGGSDEASSPGTRGGNEGSTSGDGDATDVVVDVPTMPAPVAVEGTADEQAATLAAAVKADSDEAAQAALMAALPLAGFPVVDGDQLLSKGFTGDAVAVAPWEVWTMAEAAGTGKLFLVDIARVIVSATETAAGDDEATELAAWLRDELKAAADGPDGTNRFLARFVAALGEPGDLDGPAEQLVVDALAAQILLRALAGALVAGDPSAADEDGGTATAGDADHVTLDGAVLIASTRAAAAEAGRPCTLDDDEKTIVRITEEVVSRGLRGTAIGVLKIPFFPGLVPYLVERGLDPTKELRRLSKRMGHAQIALDYLKFVLALALLRVDGTWDGAGPLVRTHDARPATGERRTFTATVRYDTGKLQLINCFRRMYANLGMRFSLPQDGSGAGLQFVPDEGFVTGSGAGGRIVQFVGPLDVTTDKQGSAKKAVEGFGQEKKKRKDAPAVARQLSFHVIVHQRANLIDDIWSALTSSEKEGLLKVPMELLKRTRWLAPKHFVHPVTDWGDDVGMFDVLISGKQTTTINAVATVCRQAQTNATQSVTFRTAKKRLEVLWAEGTNNDTRLLLVEPGTTQEGLGIGPSGNVLLARFDGAFDVDRQVSTQLGGLSDEESCDVGAGGDTDEVALEPDCGHRQFARPIVFEYAEGSLSLLDEENTDLPPVYQRCSAGEPNFLIGPAYEGVVMDPGARFDPDAMTDSDRRKITVIGGGFQHTENSGGTTYKSDSTLTWTMTLCRVEDDGTSSC